jgi:hypothetical protein
MKAWFAPPVVVRPSRLIMAAITHAVRSLA